MRFLLFRGPFFVCEMLVVLLLFLLCQEENDSVLLVASLLSERYLCSLWRRFAEGEREQVREQPPTWQVINYNRKQLIAVAVVVLISFWQLSRNLSLDDFRWRAVFFSSAIQTISFY